MKHILATIACGLLGVAAFVVLCELLFRALPVSSATKFGYHFDPKIPTYAPLHDWRYATGWDLRHAQKLRTNNFGFVSAFDFRRDESAVALIGDSYVESASLDAADRPAAQLERALAGQRAVYAMGSAGTALLDYAERIRFAHENFGIRDFVVLVERGDVRQALCGSGNVHSQCLDPKTLEPRTVTVSDPSPAKRALRDSAFAQYLVSQLKIVPGELWQQAFRRSTASETALREPQPASGEAAKREVSDQAMRVVDAVARVFFERVRPHVTGRLVIVVDSDRDALMRGRAVDDPPRRRFIERAREAGAVVVDTEPLFRAHFKQSGLSLDLDPRDGHFNPLGTRLIAVHAALALTQATR